MKAVYGERFMLVSSIGDIAKAVVAPVARQNSPKTYGAAEKAAVPEANGGKTAARIERAARKAVRVETRAAEKADRKAERAETRAAQAEARSAERAAAREEARANETSKAEPAGPQPAAPNKKPDAPHPGKAIGKPAQAAPQPVAYVQTAPRSFEASAPSDRIDDVASARDRALRLQNALRLSHLLAEIDEKSAALALFIDRSADVAAAYGQGSEAEAAYFARA